MRWQGIMTIVSTLCVGWASAAHQDIIVLLGPPGSGKGTQARTVQNVTGYPHISTGNLFRDFIAQAPQDNPKARELQEMMEQGQLIPNTLILELLQERIAQKDAVDGYILDGFPRNIAQAHIFDQMLDPTDRLLVLYFDLHDAKVLDRIVSRIVCAQCQAVYNRISNPPKREGVCDQCQGKLSLRKDDSLETAQRRLQVYHQETKPLLAHYSSKGVVTTIVPTQSVEVVSQKVRNCVESFIHKRPERS